MKKQKRSIGVKDLKKIAAKEMLQQIKNLLPISGETDHKSWCVLCNAWDLNQSDLSMIYREIEKLCNKLKKQSGELSEVDRVVDYIPVLYPIEEEEKNKKDVDIGHLIG